ncbi:phospholipase A1-Igamma1, chloroplastic-like [Panicum miliaceum]|uniref:Phospholipase A1-Igamma1, chloroplastic-like n=1 Tax=Panicum miliaceum TaxID=4540 RepID=A0A3L6QZJ8_PANMI|nr:phospholipase A1-Igamma1, chloroplastic-like [Panicum miliaceum]
MAASAISSCPSLPIAHRRPTRILGQQQLPTGRRWFSNNAEINRLQGRRRSRHHVASASTTDRPATVIGDMARGSQVTKTSSGHSDGELAARWREIHGSGNWEGLLDPIDPVLRAELIRYGEFAQATYDSFDYDRFSPYSGSCRYPAKTFFQDVGLAGVGYEVRRYLYATSNDLKFPNFGNPKHKSADDKLWSESGTFIGYVAVSTDEETARIGRRDIAVAWRGTITRLEWVADLTTNQKPLVEMGVPCPDPSVKVEMGFAELYTGKDVDCRFCRYSAREQALAEVRKLVELYHGRGEEVSVTVTGHSLGSALAMLNAFDIAETGANATPDDGSTAPVCVFSFAGPRVGNLSFRRRFERELGVRALRVVNVHDGVPKVPGAFFNEAAFPEPVLRAVDALGVGGVYTHLGVALELDHKASPFLKDTIDITCYHNLEAHLHLLDGFRGRGWGFEPRGRDPALVNKSTDFLRDEHTVPPVWYQAENKGMVRAEDGRWVLLPRHRDIDEHPEDTDHHLQRLGLTASS